MIELIAIAMAFFAAIGFGVWCHFGLEYYFEEIAKIDERYTDD